MAENGFLNIAHRLGISAPTWEDGRQGLANVRQLWMLVLDNADDPNVDYQDYFPPGASGVVVLTSRNAECEQYATAKYVALEGLSMEEATELLLKAAGVASDRRPLLDDVARRVAILLQSHPLALIQAGAYVGRGHCTLAEYPDMYRRQRKRLLGFRPSQARSRYQDVYATFEASVGILQAAKMESAHDALLLLSVLAVCGPSRLPIGLFEAGWTGAQRIPRSQAGDGDTSQLASWHISHLLPLVQVNTAKWDSFRLVEAVHILKAFALVSTDIYDGQTSVSMHPLVHAWARDRQDYQEQHKAWLQMGCLVAISGFDGDFWRMHGRQLQPHVQATTSWEMRIMFGSEPKEVIICVLEKCGWLLHNMRDDTNLFVLLNNLFTHLGLDRSTVSERWVKVYDLTARNLKNYGKVMEAARLLKQVVEIKERTLAEDHPDRLASQHELAGVYWANGQVKEAVRLLEHVVEIRGRTLAEDHPDRLASQHELAGVYEANGQVKEAVRLLEHVVEIKERTLAEDHLSRLASQHTLAEVYEANGQVKEAVRLLERVVEMEERTLAEDHPDRLASQHALAGVYEANGQVKEAVRLLEHVVEMEERTLAEDHPDRLASQHALAGVYRANGQVKEAVRLLERVVKIKERTLAEDHPDRLASQHALAGVYEANGQVKEAVRLLERVVEMEERTLAEDHPDRLASQHELAGVYEANGQVKEAVRLLERVVEMEERTLAEDHPDRLASQHALAGVCEANGQVKEAVRLLEHVVEIRGRTLAEDHPDRLASQHNLAPMLWHLGQQAAALQLMQHVAEVRRKVLDEHHPDRESSEAWLAYFNDEASNL
jgi:tetratricopeptide (TPR) repeat protein